MTLLTNSAGTRLRWFTTILLAGLIFLTGATWYSTTKFESKLVGVHAVNDQQPPVTVVCLTEQQCKSTIWSVSQPLITQATSFDPFLDVIPSQDGVELFISASGIGPLAGTVVANVDIGGGHRKGGAMVFSNTVQAYLTSIDPGFSAAQDQGGTLSITTTLGLNTGAIEFQRAFVQSTQTELISVDSNAFVVDMPNTGTVASDTYLVVMSTLALPGPLPFGYNPVGSAYNLRPSGSLTQSEKFMVLTWRFNEPLPNNSDPHTLAVVGWDQFNQTWNFLGGDLFDNTNQVDLTTKNFRIYALATTPIWRDSFKEFSLTGVSNLNNTQWGPDDTIILTAGVTSGAVTSIPITPTNAAAWGTFHFSATTSLSTSLTVDVLDLNNNVVLANATDGADLSGLLLATYPSLKLRATLTSTTVGLSPVLHEWRVSWSPKVYKAYLPLVLKNKS